MKDKKTTGLVFLHATPKQNQTAVDAICCTTFLYESLELSKGNKEHEALMKDLRLFMNENPDVIVLRTSIETSATEMFYNLVKEDIIHGGSNYEEISSFEMPVAHLECMKAYIAFIESKVDLQPRD